MVNVVYQIYHIVDGMFIGHSPYEQFDGVFETAESAKAEAERLHNKTGLTYNVYMVEKKQG